MGSHKTVIQAQETMDRVKTIMMMYVVNTVFAAHSYRLYRVQHGLWCVLNFDAINLHQKCCSI